VVYCKKILDGASKGDVDVRRTASDRNLVWVHARFTNPKYPHPHVYIDIYRVECSKIVEHWDVYQEIGDGPFANSHPYF